jgi:hypothetical protein
MYKHQINKINDIISKTGRAIISIGCSFVQGKGAIDMEILENYNCVYQGLGQALGIKISEDEKNNLLKNYKDIKIIHDELNFIDMEYKNSFTNILCSKYFENQYAPINLGISGCGNRASIKELYFYPEIKWNLLKEIIVIYCPSGLERFDFVNDSWDDHAKWVCMWPNPDSVEKPRRDLWLGYKQAIYSQKFEVLEQISHVQELISWCSLHNARLIITPAFDTRYNKNYFKESLSQNIIRDREGNLKSIGKNRSIFNSDIEKYLDLFPWNNIFYPNGYPTFVDYVLSFENSSNNELQHFWNYNGKGSPNKWITPCAHPSAKGHDKFAELLYEYITLN